MPNPVMLFWNKSSAKTKAFIVSIVIVLIHLFIFVKTIDNSRLSHFVFIAPPFVTLFALFLVYKEKTMGWILIFTHIVYFVLYSRIMTTHIFGGKQYIIYMILFLVSAAILLLKPIRKTYNIHSREIVGCIIGAFFLVTIPKLFESINLFEFAGGNLILPMIVYFMILTFLILFLKRLPPITRSNWNQYMEKLEGFTSDQYYTKLQELLEIKNVQGISYSREMLSKRGFLSSKREYLRISFEDVTHDVSFYPFALGTYASSWAYTVLTGGEAIIASIPYIGFWLHSKFYPETYFIKDSRAMFQLLVHEAQLEIIDNLTNQKGLRKLSEQQRQLQTRSVFDR